MKKMLCILLCVILLPTLSGCWSRREPKTLAIVTSIIYDILDNGMYQTTSELMNPSGAGGTQQGSGSGKSPTITAISEGLSAPEAIRNMSASIERIVFGGHNQVRFFSERLAKKDIASIIDYFLRDQLTNEAPLMVVIKGEDPERIYSCMLGLSDVVGNYMESLSKSQPSITSKAVFVSTLEFVRDYYHDGKQPVMGVVEPVACESKPSGNTQTAPQASQGDQGGSDQEYRAEYEGLAAFKDNKLAGFMNGVEARAYNFVTNNLKNAYITIPSGEDVTTMEVASSKADVITAIEGGQVLIGVKIKVGMGIVQESGLIDVTKAEALKAVEESFNRLLEGEIMAAIKKAQQEFQSDIFGFGMEVHIQHPKQWEEIKDNWDDYFSRAAVNVTVESSVNRSGEFKEPFKMEDPP